MVLMLNRLLDVSSFVTSPSTRFCAGLLSTACCAAEPGGGVWAAATPQAMQAAATSAIAFKRTLIFDLLNLRGGVESDRCREPPWCVLNLSYFMGGRAQLR